MADLRPADDASIPNDEQLFVRIYPGNDSVKRMDDGTFRPTGGGLRRYPDEPLSVDLSSVCSSEETRTRGTDGHFHVAMLVAGTVRALGFRITRDAIVDGPIPNLAHALLHGGSKRDGNGDLRGGITQNEFSKLARGARIILWAPGWQNGEPPQ